MIKKLLFIIFISLCYLLFLSCEEKSLVDPVIVISGLVTDSVTGLPVDSAVLCYEDTVQCLINVYSDSLGYYHFSPGWGYTEFTIYCIKEGYYPESKTLRSTKLKITFENINFKLQSIK